MNAFLLNCEDVLRGRTSFGEAERAPRTLRQVVLVIAACGMIYGGAMGTFGLQLNGARFEQVVFSSLKVPLLLGVTSLLSLPSFFVFNTLLGLRADWHRAFAALASTQAALALILAALSPFTLLFYASTDDYRAAIIWNTVMFAVAGLSAQKLLRRHYRPLIEADARHAVLLRAWLLLYGFIGVQMGWVLRPFVGEPHSVVSFFRPNAWSNAYEVLARIVWHNF